jgi:hypothetical protein
MDNESTLEICKKYGTKYWINAERKLHRLDGPAVEYAYGSQYWYQKGKLHRLDGPAVILSGGKKRYWYIGGIQYTSKEDFFENLTEEEKKIALFSEDFLNG